METQTATGLGEKKFLGQIGNFGGKAAYVGSGQQGSSLGFGTKLHDRWQKKVTKTQKLHISVHPNQQYPYLGCVGAGWVGLCGAAVARVGSVRGGTS